jgi:branched-chain amino acid transport system permease protein
LWVACGLAVTLGLMNFVNLAHGAFAMAGGYITVILVNRLGLPFLASLPLAFILTAAIGVVLERTLYVHVYARTHLEQVLFTIGLVFMSVAAVDYVMGSQQQFVSIPSYLQGQINLFGIGIGRYRLLIIAVCGLLTIALQFSLAKTRFGSRLRRRGRRCARGARARHQRERGFRRDLRGRSGLAGLGGALGAEILGLDPIFPLKFMIYFLIVVTVGGTSSITGPFIASLLLGIGDVAGKVLRAAVRRLHHLHHHDRGADLAAAGPVSRARSPNELSPAGTLSLPLSSSATRELCGPRALERA